MLKEMKIENFALIENVSLEFKKGFTVISGETGSGKSILIDAICFILGFKFNKNIVRNGKDKTSVEAIFDIKHEEINSILDENGIDIDDYLLIRRDGYLNGKSIVRINGKVVTNNILKSISRYLMDIHTQHQNYELLNNNKHINYLDKYIGKKLCLDEYLKVYNDWNSIRNRIYEIKNTKLNDNYIDYIKFQINELDRVNLVENEDNDLENKIKLLDNSEKLNKTINFALNCLNGEDGAVNSSIMNVLKSLKSIENILSNLKVNIDKLEEIYYDLESIYDDIKTISDTISFDPQEFDMINSRIYLIKFLKKKFDKPTVNDLINYHEELKSSINDLLDQDNIIKSLEVRQEELFNKLNIEANNIYKIRREYADRVEKEIISELNYMGMENIVFKINIEKDSEFGILGNDNVKFFISTNKGEPLIDLSKVVSGGELSRIMLALKIIFLGNEPIAGIVFDEIDIGVSGKIARKVGEKMYYLSSKCQVFCITHLPQIASLSDNHYVATKKIENDKTFTKINVINFEEKINEIAKMIGGDNITESVFINAKELIGNKIMSE